MRVMVIGGGASGMMAALTAARSGHSVILLERQARVGRKLLSTGNGRCNLTNRSLAPENYHGEDPAFCRAALDAFDVETTLEFFRELGLLTVTEPGGRVYPLSDQAGSVLDVLRLSAEAAGVELRTGCSVTALRREREGFAAETDDGTLYAERVIVCCGGAAGAKLGGSRSGYELLAALGHTVTALRPSLVQIKTDPTYVRALKGVRADAAVTLRQGKAVRRRRTGEVQFTDFGVSGPVIFELSRWVCGAGETLELDLLRDVPEEAVEELLRARQEQMPQLTTENLLTGMLHNRLGRTVLRYAGYDLTTPLEKLRESDLKRIAKSVKEFTLQVVGTLGFDNAQVTAGGVRTAEFDPRTLQSLLVSGLYAAGEVLDIDGDCGGYNLQWAWASGRLAGQLKP